MSTDKVLGPFTENSACFGMGIQAKLMENETFYLDVELKGYMEFLCLQKESKRREVFLFKCKNTEIKKVSL